MKITKFTVVAIMLAILVVVSILITPVLESKITNFLDAKLYKTGLKAQGIVVSKELNQGFVSRKNADTLYINLEPEQGYGVIHYQFRDHLGKLRAGEDMVVKAIYDKYNPEDPIPIRYFKSAPILNKIDKRSEG